MCPFRTGVLAGDCVYLDLAELEDTALVGVKGLVSRPIPSPELLVTNLSRTPFRRRSFPLAVPDESSVVTLLEDVRRQLTDKFSFPGLYDGLRITPPVSTGPEGSLFVSSS